jgi:hypothetical protein
MVPLYAAQVQDLGTGDYVVIKCGACGHTAEIPPSGLIRGLGLQPTEKVLDLERRFRYRLCYARDQAVVWRAAGRRGRQALMHTIDAINRTHRRYALHFAAAGRRQAK